MREPIGRGLELISEEAAPGACWRGGMRSGKGAGAIDEVGGVDDGGRSNALDRGAEVE